MTDETTTPDPIDESKFEIDEEAGTVATVVGSLGEVDTTELDDEGTSVATEVGSLGWPEGAENEEGTDHSGNVVASEADPSWTVKRDD
jgi:hypothetical protein